MTTAMTTPTAPAPRLVTRPFALACGAALANLTAFYLPLSVVPARAVAAGAPDGAAGLVTAALMVGGVLAECVAPRLMSRFGDRAVLTTGLLLLGGAALLLVPAVDVVSAVLVCGLRGLGFGFAVVVTGALVTRHVPAARRGEGLAVAGVAACLPAVAALPAGVWLADTCGADVVFVVAALVALVGALAPLALGRGAGSARSSAESAAAAAIGVPQSASAAVVAAPESAADPAVGAAEPYAATAAGAAEPEAAPAAGGLMALARVPVQRRSAVLFAATTVAAGIVVAYLPLATAGPAVALGLFVQALAATAARYGAGRWGDRHGHARLVGPGLAACGLGMVLLLGVDQPAVLLAAMAVFGTGFGVAQSATYAVMVERAPAGGDGAVSALWNLAYDLGYGVGPLAFAAVVGASGYPAAFALTGLVVLAGLRAARRVG
jgi:MFS family permease